MPNAIRTVIIAAAALGSLASAQLYGTADELMAAVEARPEPTTTEATLTMTITTAGGQTLTREMRMWAQGDSKRLIKFTAPADIAGSGFLTVTHEDGQEEKLVYLPALDRVRRIAGGQESDAFFGSDFSYQDIAGMDPDDYTHRLLETRDGPTYVVEAVPTAASASPYDRLVLYVPEATLVPARVEFYRDGAMSKVLTVSDLIELDGYLLAGERRMETLTDGAVSTFTIIRQTGVTLDQQLPGEVFSERFLRR